MTEREIERRARELLAAEYRAERYEDAALRAEQGSLLHPADKAAIRAIIAALESLSPPEGVEAMRPRDWIDDIRAAISDPGKLAGMRGQMSLSSWQAEAVVAVLELELAALSTFPGGGATGGGEE